MNWIFGDNINTDLITPGRYNITTNPQELSEIAFIEHRPEFSKQVKKGDFITAGNNFGSGSSRETAVIALKQSGIKAIFARSFARIFYRNALNQGLLTIATKVSDVKQDDVLELDLTRKILINKTQHTQTKLEIPALLLKLHRAGGIVKYLNKHGLNSIESLFVTGSQPVLKTYKIGSRKVR
ncbi:MAG: 3-isopropylmalate dehydratase [Candidatus Pacebacteria bacterium CG10_big_fil_rev_8_21_14_0_10_56_10]|nr:MAG: 3-isopropylmalate dehydratase [Candidatus Pacebacteria bacterium CG10_big_fil_rev_8_21_14_0_10_56_10]